MRLHSPRPPRGVTRPRAFTLVELLVVIGIIALLISILLPTLGRVRQSGQTTVCLSNLRQLASAYRMYADANNGWLPYAVNSTWGDTYTRSDGSITELYWFKSLMPYLAKNVDPLEMRGDEVSKVLKACPTWPQFINPDASSEEWRPGYGQNIYMFAGYRDGKRIPRGSEMPRNTPLTTSGHTPEVFIGQGPGAEQNWRMGTIKLSAIPSASTRILAGDSPNYWLGVSRDARSANPPVGMELDFARDFTNTFWATTIWSGGHPNRHGGTVADCRFDGKGAGGNRARANYLFVDGHASTLSYFEARKALQAP